MADEKKGITVKIDAALHAEIRQFIEQNGMTMADFVSQALYNELHPKIQPQEVKNMGPTRTMAFQMPEDMFQRLKDYLHRHGITQKDFVLGLVEAEIRRDEELINAQNAAKLDETAENISDEKAEIIGEELEDIEEPDEDETEDEDFDEDMDDIEEPDEDEDLDDEESEDEDEELDDEESEDEDLSEEQDEDFSMAM
ncbi:hypothetical protein [Ruminococcus flavefaciens]|uniref:hypothetical protein n=1 Tax=Ruminococcus flavefaciens TaxID=1265 RepID=UPI0026EB28DE|nr:hypothetical protein [Ruminococcus flavefaciens]